MTISLIIPVYNEAETIPILWKRLVEVTGSFPAYNFEIVFVDDGSKDESAKLISELPAGKQVSVKLVKFSRNFGHQAAVSAGMEYASGDALVFLDADLQDPPELIAKFLEKFNEGYEVVYAVRQNRKEGWLRVMAFSAFYRLFNMLADRPMPLDSGDFSLISKRVAKLIAAMPEHDRLIRGMRSWVGFKQIGIPYDRPERAIGETRYGFRKHLELALDGLFSFSKAPVRFSLFVGIFVVLIGGIYLAISYLRAMFTVDTAPEGWKSLITLVFMAAGANIIATSIVGEYVCRIYFQTKGRPLFVVDAVVNRKDGEGSGQPPIQR